MTDKIDIPQGGGTDALLDHIEALSACLVKATLTIDALIAQEGGE